MLCVYRKSIEPKTSQEKREREREHADDTKKKEKEKVMKEESAKRPEKEVKKIEPVTVKKPEPSVSPKKLQTTSLPITRHRVSLNFIYSYKCYILCNICVHVCSIYKIRIIYRESFYKIFVSFDFSVLEELVPYSLAFQENRRHCSSS